MTAVQAAALWIGVNILFLVYVSMRVGQARMKTKVSLGDGGDETMIRAIRTQGNYVEYAPAALLGLLALAQLGTAASIIHALGAAFLAARIAHLLGLGLNLWPAGRFVGTLGTMATLVATAGLLLVKAFGATG